MYNDAVNGMTKRLLHRSSTGLLYCGEEQLGRIKPEMGHLTCFVGGMLALGVMHGVNPETAERDLANAKALGYLYMGVSSIGILVIVCTKVLQPASPVRP